MQWWKENEITSKKLVFAGGKKREGIKRNGNSVW